MTTDTGARINELTAELLLIHPHLTPSRAYQIVLERDPRLAEMHFRGDDGLVHQDDGITHRDTIIDLGPSTRPDPAAMTHYNELDPEMRRRYRPGARS